MWLILFRIYCGFFVLSMIHGKAVNGTVKSFITIGDWGTGSTLQKQIANSMGKVATEKNIQFVLNVGDSFYDEGVNNKNDPKWNIRFENVYTATGLQVPWVSMLGNHDKGNSVGMGSSREKAKVQAQLSRHEVVLSNGRLNRWYMPNPYYVENFDIGNGKQFTLIVMDTDPFASRKTNLISQNLQMKFLQDSINTYLAKSVFILVAGHHGNEGAINTRIRPLLTKYRIPYICGHMHVVAIRSPLVIVNGGGGAHGPSHGFTLHEFVANGSMKISLYNEKGAITRSITIPSRTVLPSKTFSTEFDSNTQDFTSSNDYESSGFEFSTEIIIVCCFATVLISLILLFAYKHCSVEYVQPLVDVTTSEKSVTIKTEPIEAFSTEI